MKNVIEVFEFTVAVCSVRIMKLQEPEGVRNTRSSRDLGV